MSAAQKIGRALPTQYGLSLGRIRRPEAVVQRVSCREVRSEMRASNGQPWRIGSSARLGSVGSSNARRGGTVDRPHVQGH